MEHIDEIAQDMADEGGVITYTTWNPLDKGANLTLSNGDLTATMTAAGWSGVRAVASSSTAKWYFETSAAGSSNLLWFGIALTSADFVNAGVQSGTTAYWGGGQLWSEGGSKVSGLPSSTIATIRCAVDLGTQEIWFGDESGWWNSGDPGAGTNPLYSGFPSATYFPMIWLNSNTTTSTSNFGQGFSYAIPSGFTGVF